MKKVVIIGNGISGVTAARFIRKLSDYEITIISSETPHFISRTALMYVYMGHMKYEHIKPYEDYFWEQNKINLIQSRVEEIDTSSKKLITEDGSIGYDELIIACGSKPNKFGWEGQDLPQVQGLYSWQDLETMEQHTKNIQNAVIVGGGLIGVEVAEMLKSRNIDVDFLVREELFWGNVLPKEEGELISRHIQSHDVKLHFSTELEKINADENGNVKSITTKEGREINCQFVALTAGVSPNIDFIKSSSIKTNRGVLVDEKLRTNQPQVYAIGDCAEFMKHPTGRRNIEQVWYTGKMMGETVAHTIVGKETNYQPGVWFNSAKFFDIEYQTYGNVNSKPQEHEKQLYWEDSNSNKALRLVFNENTNALMGLNSFGIRIRHQVLDEWIVQERSIDEVVQHLHEANFDPEFYHNSLSLAQKKFKSLRA